MEVFLFSPVLSALKCPSIGLLFTPSGVATRPVSGGLSISGSFGMSLRMLSPSYSPFASCSSPLAFESNISMASLSSSTTGFRSLSNLDFERFTIDTATLWFLVSKSRTEVNKPCCVSEHFLDIDSIEFSSSIVLWRAYLNSSSSMTSEKAFSLLHACSSLVLS